MTNPIFQGAGTEIIGVDAMNTVQQIFNLRQKMYGEAGVITMGSYLRAETLLTDGVASIPLSFAQNNARVAPFVTERRLLQNDTFSTLGLSLHIGRVVVAGAAETEAEHAQMTLHTFPNPLVFTAGELEALYNGALEMTVDSTKFIEGIATRDFYRVGTSQAGVGSSAVSNAPVQSDEWQFQQYGQRNLTPSMELSGRANIVTNVNLGTSVDLAAPSGENYYLVGQLFGFINTGASSIYEAWLKSLSTSGFSNEYLPNIPMFKKSRS